MDAILSASDASLSHSNASLSASLEVGKGGLSLTSRFESVASVSDGTATAGGEGASENEAGPGLGKDFAGEKAEVGETKKSDNEEVKDGEKDAEG
jgi:hypothetical protein